MEKVNRLLTNICSDDLVKSRDFYTKLFDFKVSFDSDWFVQLHSKDENLELGIVKRTHEIVPEGFQTNPQGFYITFVVDSADAIYELAKSEKIEIVRDPEDTFYGQRRVLLKDPAGVLVDVSSPIKDFSF